MYRCQKSEIGAGGCIGEDGHSRRVRTESTGSGTGSGTGTGTDTGTGTGTGTGSGFPRRHNNKQRTAMPRKPGRAIGSDGP